MSTVTEAPISELDTALAALGATPDLLTADDREQLSDRGFVVWQRILPAPLVAELRAAYDAIAAAEGAGAGHDYQQEGGALRLGNLPNKAACFDAVWLHPRYLAAVRHVLGAPFALSSLSAREPIPLWDGSDQNLHRDGMRAVDAVVLLDDATWAAGAPRIIPGSQRWPTGPEVLADGTAPHPDEVIVEAPAGSMVVFDGQCWHSGRRSRNGVRRRALFPFFVSDRAQAGAYQRQHLGSALAARLTPASRWLLALDEPAPAARSTSAY
jgi:hypothetical protein